MGSETHFILKETRRYVLIMADWTDGRVMKNTEGKVMGSEYEAG